MRFRVNTIDLRIAGAQTRLHKKSEFIEAKLHYMTHMLLGNCNGFVIDIESTQ